MFEPVGMLLLGVFTGLIFGLLLQKGRVAKFHVILGQLLLKDWTVVKVMITAIAVGAVGVYFLAYNDAANLHIKPFHYAGVLVGAILFGVGMTILGYCPGTSVAGCGEGRRDAMMGVVGMLSGALVYVLGYPWWHSLRISLGTLGETTIPYILSLSPWVVVAATIALICAILGIVAYFERRGVLREAKPTGTPRSPGWWQRLNRKGSQHTT